VTVVSRRSLQDRLAIVNAAGSDLNVTDAGRALFCRAVVDLAARSDVAPGDQRWLLQQLQQVCSYHGFDLAQLVMDESLKEQARS
jgi:hypothetical protein